ncbi:MAG: hypothetical protein NTW19_20090 [Planctomycetota bacterium]|nr:hypothetical protein [Planctomycetota bacterium]
MTPTPSPDPSRPRTRFQRRPIVQFAIAAVACVVAFASFLLAPAEHVGQPTAKAAADEPKKQVSLLILSEKADIDPQYQSELAEAGYRLTLKPFTTTLSPAYLRQFGAVILTQFPIAGQQYEPGGESMAAFWRNIDLLHDYLDAGGGVLFEPAANKYPEAHAETCDRVFQRYGLRLLPQQLRDDARTKGQYAEGKVAGGHTINKGVDELLYPIAPMRFTNVPSTSPLLVDKNWKVLARGMDGSGTHRPLDQGKFGPELTQERTLFAIRKTGKGLLAASSIHSSYTLTQAYNKGAVPIGGSISSIAPSQTGAIDGVVLQGEKNGRRSDWGKLLDNALRFMAANSAENQIGIGEVAPPDQPAPIAATPVIDWSTAQPPPTWQHRATQAWIGKQAYYDEMPDPLVQGEMKYFKALVGARTAASSGKGTVKEYREAAIKAGYSAIAFSETFADLTPEKWDRFVKDCQANTDEAFHCLPGLDLEDFQGGRWLILDVATLPDPRWLTPDGKKVRETRMLMVGWYGHLSCIHRSGRTPIHPKMYRHFHGLSVFTYDGKGKLVDDALPAYQWQVHADCNPIPITAHEVADPADVALASTTGFQQILPAPTLALAVDYFRYGLAHYFDCPQRYFISEGPLLEGWSIRNKDLGKPEENRDHYRLGIQVTSDEPIAEATLYDGLDVAGRWFPDGRVFKTQVDGPHDAQKEFMLLARDAKGRRVLSPGIRTTVRNWRSRTSERHYWMGSLYYATGWYLPGFGDFIVPLVDSLESGSKQAHAPGGPTPAPILDFPFFSNHVQVDDADVTHKYVDDVDTGVGNCARPAYAVRSTDFIDGHVRVTHFLPKRESFSAARVDVAIRLKRDAEPDHAAPVFPTIASAMGTNDVLILPGKPAQSLAALKEPIDLPVGSYVGGVITLTPGLRLSGRSIGFPGPPAETLTLPEGTSWKASYVVLKSSKFVWHAMQSGYDFAEATRNAFEGMRPRSSTSPSTTLPSGSLAEPAESSAAKRALAQLGFPGAAPDNLTSARFKIEETVAKAALAEMGLAGPTPYTFTLTQGKLDKVAHQAEFTAAEGGIAGSCKNADAAGLVYDVPLRIAGLNPRCPAAVWRSDSPRLDYFACFEGAGMVTFNADKPVDFFAGNVAACNPALIVSIVAWSDSAACFRVNNPTRRDITAAFATNPGFKGYKPVKKEITIKAGTSVEVRE